MHKELRTILIIIAILLTLAAVAVILYYAIYKPLQKHRAEELFRQYYNSKIASYDAENKIYSPGQVDVVFLGDSLTDGYDLSKYYPEYITLNRGISGDTTFGLEDRLQVSIYDVQPKVAVMLIGANNFQTMLDNYEQILMGFQQNLPNTKIVLLSLTSMAGDWARNNQIAAQNNAKIQNLAQQYGYSFIDLYAPLLDESTGEMKLEYTTDGGHFTEKGYDVVTAEIKPVIDNLLH